MNKALEYLKKQQIELIWILQRDPEEYQNALLELQEAITELEAQETKSCATCRKKLLCKIADRAKLEFGTKLNEMWFNCHELKDINVHSV